MKNAGFRIRVDDELRARFIDVCKSRERTAAQVLREFMRTYVDRLGDPNQLKLFGDQAAIAEKIAESNNNSNIENPDAYENHSSTRASGRPDRK